MLSDRLRVRSLVQPVPLRPLLGRFARQETGAVAIMATLMMPLLLALGAVAMDYTNASRLRATTASALDAALLAAAREVSLGRLDESDIETFVNSFFNANLTIEGLNASSIGQVTTSYNEDTGRIVGSVEANANATFSKILNPDGVRVGVDAEVTVSLLNIELALVLDVTGSMSGSKLEALESASEALVDTLLPPGGGGGPAEVRISLVPYADTVNVGDFEPAITGYSSGESCVYERSGSYAFVDDEPLGPVPGTGVSTPFGLDDDGVLNTIPGGNGNRPDKSLITHPSNFRGYACSRPELLPLTSTRSELISQINAFSASGWTAGHIGIQWGWYTLSPEFAGIWSAPSAPAAYDDEETLKVLVIMTDGAFNTWYEDGIGNSFAQGEDLCDAIRDTNIRVFTVGFLTGTVEENFLRDCAGPDGMYFDANSEADLVKEFEQIGQLLTEIRLTS